MSENIKVALNLKDDYSFLPNEENFSFLLEKKLIDDNDYQILISDLHLLFPYVKDDKYFKGDVYIDNRISIVFPYDDKKLSFLRVKDYDEALKDYIEMSDHFHALVEKKMLLDFLRNERGLKNKVEFNFYYIYKYKDEDDYLNIRKYLRFENKYLKHIVDLGINSSESKITYLLEGENGIIKY